MGLFDKDESLLYSLNVFGSDESEPTDAATSSAATHVSDQTDRDEILENPDNIWDINLLPNTQSEGGLIRSWDTFPNHPASQWQPLSLSESGGRGFDAALVHQATRSGLENSGRVTKTEPFLFSLFKLGLGWNSIFFRFNEQTRRFEKDIRDARISGISLPALDSLIQEFLECGTYVRYIRQFIANSSNYAPASSVSGLCRAVFVLLYSVEDQMFERFKAGQSFLELQESFRRCGCMMKCLLDITSKAKDANSDRETISNVFAKCDYYSQQFVWLSDILHELMTLVAKPWLSTVATWIGLETQPPGLNLVLGTCDMPDVVPPEHAEAIPESGRILRLLRELHPHHPLLERNAFSSAAQMHAFECAITWEDIDRIQSKSYAYEAEVKSEILKYMLSQIDGTNDSDTLMLESEEGQSCVDGLYELSDLDMSDASRRLAPGDPIISQKLYKLLSESQCLDPNETLDIETPFGPPLGMSVYLSFAPFISAQSRLINFSYLQVLFQRHKVRDHLKLQWRFQLLGDPTFISRLSHTLFDPDMRSGERKKGVARGGLSTGLRLGNRDTWPPATSELRLVLMGMLTECYHIGNKTEENQPRSEDELPGGLSFAIRDLTDEEITKCKNPNAIEALDFLRLQYNPPPLLDEIITSESLERYDRLFKYLLRLSRMMSVVQSLIRDVTNRHSPNGTRANVEYRFRYEAQHFVQAINDYSFNVCVADTWRRFDKSLAKIEQCIKKGDIDRTLEHAQSPSRLRAYHEDVLEQILFALFLTKKHVQVVKQLEYIFGTILAYASLSKQERSSSLNYESSVNKLYASFRKLVGGFVKFLRSMDAGKVTMSGGKHRDLAAWGGGQAANTEVRSVFEHLLLRLDMKEYY